ncbi:MAG: hypothetical protein ABFS08_11375 [Pseudomonadota bacterium]
MSMRTRSIVVLLVLLNALLLSLVLYEFVSLQQVEDESASAMETPATELSLPQRAPVISRSIKDYGAVIARPLFNKERRPLEKDDNAGSDEDALAFTLVGVVLAGEQQVAIIYSRSQKQPVKVSLWGWIEGWRLVSVQAQGVHLRKGNRSLELELQRTSQAGTK